MQCPERNGRHWGPRRDIAHWHHGRKRARNDREQGPVGGGTRQRPKSIVCFNDVDDMALQASDGMYECAWWNEWSRERKRNADSSQNLKDRKRARDAVKT